MLLILNEWINTSNALLFVKYSYHIRKCGICQKELIPGKCIRGDNTPEQTYRLEGEGSMGRSAVKVVPMPASLMTWMLPLWR